MSTPRDADVTMGRRSFLRLAAGAGAAAAAAPRLSVLAAEAEAAKAQVWVLHGADKKKLMAEALKIIDANGGLGTNVKTLALKVNSAWTRTPELGGNTHPELVTAFIQGAKAAGVGQIVVPENPCHRPAECFKASGILEAVTQAGATMIDLKAETKYFVDTKFPKGKKLTQAKVARQFLESDCVVNMPVAKHHGATQLTLGMKNWMGSVQDRNFWHRNGLPQCIADFATLLQPKWTIIDATRMMLRAGPQGGKPEFLKKPDPDLLIVAKQQVAADAYTATLFDKKPADIPFLKMAGEAGLGVIDPAQIKVTKIEVS